MSVASTNSHIFICQSVKIVDFIDDFWHSSSIERPERGTSHVDVRHLNSFTHTVAYTGVDVL